MSGTARLERLRDLLSTEEGRRTHQRVNFAMSVTEKLCDQMEEAGITTAELAQRMGCDVSQVDQWLSDERDITLGTLSDIAFALGVKCDVSFSPQNSLTLEIAYFEEHVARWVEGGHEDSWVVVQGEKLLGFYESVAVGFDAGVEEFGTAKPFLVKEVRLQDRLVAFFQSFETVG